MLSTLLSGFCLVAALCLLRLYCILPGNSSRPAGKSPSGSTKSLAVFLGSGGHTSEALALLTTLDFERYTPRAYFISEGDHLSAGKARELELSKAPCNAQYIIITIPRARRVHQPLWSTPPTALRSLLTCIGYITIKPKSSRISFQPPFADLLILNGPGTCFVMCIAVYINKFLGLPAPKMIYVESFARVRSLSLSGRLLRPIVDCFVVQWPQSLADGGRGECRGWLV